ncbi:MAG TPA: hypothetical protein PKO15_09320 [Fibrobacteria bacterium]|nr:hypothetical protein [Fibrobacteria bacterium]
MNQTHFGHTRSRSLPSRVAALALMASIAHAQYPGPRDLGVLQTDQAKEASGIAASRVSDTVLWTHNDSGDEPRIFAISTTGALLGTFHLPATARDWEDIAAGPGPEAGKNYLYVADIGDNLGLFSVKEVYRLEEPSLSRLGADRTATVTRIDTLRFRYPDGERDAEALMVDPRTRDLYVITKREDRVHVYLGKYPQSTQQVQTLVAVDTLDLHKVVAADISPSGDRILAKTYDSVYLWERGPDQSIAQALRMPPTTLPYVREPQGEGLCWNRAGTGYFTLSERKKKKKPQHLYFYGK